MSDPQPQPPRTRLPHQHRANHPPPMQLTARDRTVLETMYAYDGLLSDDQLTKRFFHSKRRMQARMSLLYHHGFVARTTRAQRAQLDYTVYWLDERGAEYIAQREGISLEQVRWRKPGERWSLTQHDVELNDLRFWIEEAVHGLPDVQLETWVSSSQFWQDWDRVRYTTGGGKPARRGVRPDGYFLLRRGNRKRRFLVEWDRRTEHNPRFVEEKLRPGLAYIESDAYRERFGHNSGTWLIITTGATRRTHMLKQTMASGVATTNRVYFASRLDVRAETIFTAPIWYLPEVDRPQALLTSFLSDTP